MVSPFVACPWASAAYNVVDNCPLKPWLSLALTLQKRANIWSDATLGATGLEQKKLIFHNSLFPTMPLNAYRPLEYQCAFYNQSNKINNFNST